MSGKRDRIEQLLDEAVREIGDEKVDPVVVKEAADRVWTTLSSRDPSESRPRAVELRVVGDCDEFRGLIKPYLNNELSEPRSLLLEDHLNECFSCRRELKIARDGVESALPVPYQSTGLSRQVWLGVAAAAVVLVALGLGRLGLWERLLPAPRGPVAVVEALDGFLLNVSGGSGETLESGQQIMAGKNLRTAKDSGALLSLRDGSTVELGERAEVTIRETRSGRTIDLHRGSIIVQAAKQKEGFLKVRTADCLVQVKGTVFSVSRGLKGSRVSVIEGIVSVESQGKHRQLKAGQQMSTRKSLTSVSLEKEIAWSRNLDEHIALLQTLTSLQEELEGTLTPGLTFSTSLVALTPEDAVLYASLPNLSGGILEAYELFEQRVQESSELQEWLGQTGADDRVLLEELLKKIQTLGNLLGPELVVWFEMGESSEPEDLTLISEAADAAALLGALDQEVNAANSEAGTEVLRLVSDPAQLSAESTAELHLMVWHGLFAASPAAASLQRLASASPRPTPFSQRIARAYEEGVVFLVAVDLERIMTRQISPEEAQALGEAGLLDTRFVLIERKPSGNQTETRAVVTFARERRGIASWLATPAPMGALDFVSADSHLAGAFVIKDPVLMVEDILGFMEGAAPEILQELAAFQAEKGVDIQHFAEPIGGEIMFALDGPVLPSPGWKIVLEVYDPAAFQETLDWIIEELNMELQEEGKAGVELLIESSDGRVFYSLVSEDSTPEIHYVFVDGYLLAGPNRALLQNAIGQRETGYTLVNAERFQELLPADGMSSVSGLLFQDMGKILSSLADLSGASAEQKGLLVGVLSGMEPTLFYAYGGEDQITLGSTATQFAGLNVASLMSIAGGGLDNLFRGSGAARSWPGNMN